MNISSSIEKDALTDRALNLLAVAAAISAANAYYIQPLLVEIGNSLSLSSSMLGLLPGITQVGLAIGLLTLVPLADLLSARSLLIVMVPLQVAALVLMATASNAWLVVAACFGIGLFGIAPYLLPPYASLRVPADRLGLTTGLLARGVIFGIVLGRTGAGLIATSFGWRYVYIFAGAAMIGVFVLFRRTVKPEPRRAARSYRETLLSLFSLLKTVPALRVASICMMFSFGSFNVCWIGLSIYLQQHHGWQPGLVGLVGLLGAFGALLAPRIGRIADRVGSSTARIVALATMVVGWVLFAVLRDSLLGMSIVLIIFDVSAAVVDISNRTLLYAASPGSRNRLNAIYQVSMFLGGSLVAMLIGIFWSWGGWSALCTLGGGSAGIAGLIAWRFRKLRA